MGITPKDLDGVCSGKHHVEVLKDITFRLAPATRDDALSMLDGIAAAEILKGVRGTDPVDREALAGMIEREAHCGAPAEGIADAVRSLDASPVKGGLAVKLVLDSKVELPADPPRPMALAALRIVADQMGEPVGLGDSVKTIEIVIYGPGSDKPALDMVIKRADLESWHNGGLTDSSFEKRWSAP